MNQEKEESIKHVIINTNYSNSAIATFYGSDSETVAAIRLDLYNEIVEGGL